MWNIWVFDSFKLSWAPVSRQKKSICLYFPVCFPSLVLVGEGGCVWQQLGACLLSSSPRQREREYLLFIHYTLAQCPYYIVFTLYNFSLWSILRKSYEHSMIKLQKCPRSECPGVVIHGEPGHGEAGRLQSGLRVFPAQHLLLSLLVLIIIIFIISIIIVMIL